LIQSFASKETQALYKRNWVAKYPPEIQRLAFRKLLMLHSAVTLGDLKIPPGNRLEKLKSKGVGQYSIRINSQWRICFRFENGHAFAVEITDYH